MFTSLELSRLLKGGGMNQFLKQYGNLVNSNTFIACGGDTAVFDYNNQVIKVVPKNIRFFKHFGNDRHSAKDFKKYINRLEPFFLPVGEVMYENDDFFVYTQEKCKLIESKRINKKTVINLFRLIQFMIVNNVILTDLAPHNLGVSNKGLVVFDYHGLHRLTKNGKIKRPDWWRRLARNLTRFMCGLYCPKKRSQYSQMMQQCDSYVIKTMTADKDLPSVFTELIKYLMTQQNHVSIEELCNHLEQCIKYIKKKDI